MGWRTDRHRGAPEGVGSNDLISPKIVRWDHVCIAVESLERLIKMFRDVFGAQFIVGGDNHQIGVRSMVFKMPMSTKIEFLMPLREDSYLTKFLKENGEGFHHATVFVDNIVQTIADLGEAGFELVDQELSDPHWKEVFLRPKTTFGSLIQLVESDLNWLEPHPVCTPEATMRGEWRWWGAQTWHISALPDDYVDEPSTKFKKL